MNGSDMVITFHHCEHIEFTKSCRGTGYKRVLVQQRYKSILWLTRPQVTAALFSMVGPCACTHTHRDTYTRVFCTRGYLMCYHNGNHISCSLSTFAKALIILEWKMSNEYKTCIERPTVLYFYPGFVLIDCSSHD